ncbi:hypothetical protein SUGI_0620220 [Cryptomeria japonica]|nr:hypothetical protein SUGI_0620220 [Cryptomeria japonica]
MDPLLHPPSYLSLNDFCYKILSLKELACLGSWRAILDKVTQLHKMCLLQKPHENLTYMAYNVLSLAKIRRYEELSEELGTLKNFEDPKYRLADIKETIDHLYGLFDFVKNKITVIEFKIKIDKHLVELSNDGLGS